MPLGGGVVPFNNLEFRVITDEEIKSFDNIRQGIDWGYSVDPMSFGRMHYDATSRILYIFDEFYGIKVPNRELAYKINKKNYNDVTITADSAEPKSISELREYGIKISGAKKGAGSVEYGEKWLDDLEAIVIDPSRCPNHAREFESIDYKIDKDGNTIPKLEEVNNHSIDEIRYAMEDDMKNRTLKVVSGF
jgi:phage terminase large subunit